MRKITAVFAAVLLVAVGGAAVAFAQDEPGPVEPATGQGKDNPCLDEDGNPIEGETCPDPVDPTADYEPLTPAESPVQVAAAGDPEAMDGGAAVAIGDENQDNSVGRAGVNGNQERANIQVYVEDYTDGNQLAGAVAQLNAATECRIVEPAEGEECDAESDSDAALITITPPVPAP